MLSEILHSHFSVCADNIGNSEIFIVYFSKHEFSEIFTIFRIQIIRLRTQNVIIKRSHLFNRPKSFPRNSNKNILPQYIRIELSLNLMNSPKNFMPT